MIDAHCHLDFDRFDKDRDELLARARSVGVQGWIVAGVRPEDWQRQAALEKYDDVHVAYGIHPHVAAQWYGNELEDAMAELRQRRGIAVGEMGLDGGNYVPRGSLPFQLKAFRAQLSLARELNLPVILHIFGPHGMAIDTLKRDGLPQAGGMVHSYSGSAELVQRYEQLGLYISFSGSITRPTARRPLKAASVVSPDRLLVETDCPDQRPSGREGSRNLPEYLPDIVTAVAAVREESEERISALCADNARRLFGI